MSEGGKLSTSSGDLHTLAEASRLMGTTVDALRKRVRRRQLAAVRGNDGLIRVRLDAVAAASRELDNQHSRLSGLTSLGEIPASSGELAALRTALDREQARADTAEQQLAEARTLIELATADLRQQGERAARAEGELVGVRVALAEARRPIWRRWLGRL